MEAYRAVHTPDEHPLNDFLLLAHNHTTIYDLATRLGLRVSIDHWMVMTISSGSPIREVG